MFHGRSSLYEELWEETGLHMASYYMHDENVCFDYCLFHRNSSLYGNFDFSGPVFVCLIYSLLRQRFSWFPFTYPEPDLNLM